MLAIALVGWSLLALRQRRLWPRLALGRRGRRLGIGTVAVLTSALLIYWLLRLKLQAFPSG
jgi:hypothetical protein